MGDRSVFSFRFRPHAVICLRQGEACRDQRLHAVRRTQRGESIISPIEAVFELLCERAMSVRMRRTSSIACGLWCVPWPEGTMCSDVAPSKCELQYGTTPSEEFGASPLPRSPMMV